MELDISKIVADKIKEMEDSGSLKKKIEDDIEKTIYAVIDDAFTGYEFTRKIKDSVNKSIDPIVYQIGFTAYNQMIIDKINAIMQVELRDDVAAKIETTINNLLFKKRKEICLSEIFKAYRDWVNNNADGDEKREREYFTCELTEEDKTYATSYTYFRVKFHETELESKSRYGSTNPPDIEFSISQSKEGDPGNIYHVLLEGNQIEKKFSLRYLNDVEALILNLFYNKTPIVMDIENIDNDDNQYYYDENEQY